eukprot:6206138-Pleurochrysis_carterae.AAC.9
MACEEATSQPCTTGECAVQISESNLASTKYRRGWRSPSKSLEHSACGQGPFAIQLRVPGGARTHA